MKQNIRELSLIILGFSIGVLVHYYYVSIAINDIIVDHFDRTLKIKTESSMISNDDTLPTILIIGDSISAGYYSPLKWLLKGRCNVVRVPENARDSGNTVKKIDSWLSKCEMPEIIIFNNGLHDLKYSENQSAVVGLGKSVTVNIDNYKNNMISIVKVLRNTNAKLVFATTTPVPTGSVDRESGMEVRYNNVAKEIMKQNGVAICDLHSIAFPFSRMIQKRTNIHPNPIGSLILAVGISSIVLNEI